MKACCELYPQHAFYFTKTDVDNFLYKKSLLSICS